MTPPEPARASALSAGAPSAVSARGAARRAAILASAVDLFSRNGYAAVGMSHIGAAAGVTGPAIYRHFPSKAAMLAGIFDTVIDTVITAPSEPRSVVPADRLRDAIGTYAAGVSANRTVMAVFVREVHHLPAGEYDRLRDRQRTLVQHWRTLLAAVHPDWDGERVRTAVHAAFGLLNSVGLFSSPLADAPLAAQLRTLAIAALEIPGAS